MPPASIVSATPPRQGQHPGERKRGRTAGPMLGLRPRRPSGSSPERGARNTVRRDPVLWSRATAVWLLPGQGRGRLTLPVRKGLLHAGAAVYGLRRS